MENMINKDRVKQFMKVDTGHIVKDTIYNDLYVVAQVDELMYQLIGVSECCFGNRCTDDCFMKEDLIIYLASETDFEYFGEFKDYCRYVSNME